MSAVATSPRLEERAARRRQRALERAQRVSRAKAARRRTQAISQAIQELETRGCRCGLRSGMDDADLRALGPGCTAPRHVCPTLDAVRRRVGP